MTAGAAGAPAVTADDAHWLGLAVAAAAENVAQGGGPFGALVVRDGEVLATGVNQVTTSLDPTAHAEVVAIRAACRRLGSFRLDGCLLVASCEPCPLCLSAALWARMARIVYAADRDDAARAGFDDRAFYQVFATPQEQWPLTVRRLDGPDRTLPFDRWLARADRVEY